MHQPVATRRKSFARAVCRALLAIGASVAAGCAGSAPGDGAGAGGTQPPSGGRGGGGGSATGGTSTAGTNGTGGTGATGGAASAGASGGGTTGGSAGTGAGGDAGGAGGASGGAGTAGNAGKGGAIGGRGGMAGASGSGGAGGRGGGGATAAGGAGTGGRGGTGGGAAGSSGTCPNPVATFNDITARHAVPAWLTDPNAKFGISIHFGPYSVGAHHNEWDSRHMYCDASIRAWYIQNFGTNGTVGYKDLAAKMTLANFDPTAWAAAFKKSKATWVQISAQHHDRFAMWDSALTRWSIAKVGGKRDVVGELATAVRAQGMRFGVQNHILYGYSFQWCGSGADKSVDLYDPAYADLYGDYAGWDPTKAQPYASSGPPNGGCDITGSGICAAGHPNQGFMNEWLARSKELTDKYKPDVHWFDWDGVGANHATKLAFATYYYNAACAWGKDVAMAGKGGVLPGDDNSATGANIMIHDFETAGHAPASGAEPRAFWFVDDKIGSTWGYTTGMTYRSASSIISQIKDYRARGGMLILNISPRGDGSIPQEQLDVLTAIGNAL